MFSLSQYGFATFDTLSPTEKCSLFLGTFALSSAANWDAAAAAAIVLVDTAVIVDAGSDDGVVNHSRFGQRYR